jgi:hypothetical protein
MFKSGFDPVLSLGFPMGAEWLCILAFLAVVAVICVVVFQSLNRRPPVGPSGFPVGPPSFPPGPAEYKVFGVDRQTKTDRVWHCTADSPENARVKGELEGMVVTRIERV